MQRGCFPDCDGCRYVCPFDNHWDEYEYQPPLCPGVDRVSRIEMEIHEQQLEEIREQAMGRFY